MPNVYHILNGDALKEQFPDTISGEIIVFRECLVDGPVQAEDLEKLFELRAKFIAENYGDFEETDYFEITASELSKITEIPGGSTVHLWFEDDLFCQVNFWCAVHLLSSKNAELYLVRPESHSQYGFGKYKPEELPGLLENRIPINDPKKIAALWKAYQNEDPEALTRISAGLKDTYPFIDHAIQAHLQRIPGKDFEGRPVESLKQIIREIGSESFGPVFREFNKREHIYGFGDLQIKRMFDEIVGKV